MGTILKIAIRNITEHKAKSFIVGMLIAIGIMVVVLSKSILDTAEEGSKKVFIENYTAHLMVSRKMEKENETMTAFGFVDGGPQIMGGSSESPTIPQYKKVYEYLSSIPEVKAVNSQNAGISALIKFDESMDEIAWSKYWGIDPENYLQMFPDNIEILKGEFLKSNEQGVLLNIKVVNDVKEKLDREFNVGEMITIQTYSKGIKIHEVPLKGIFKYKSGNASVSMMNLIDVESYRILAKMIVGTIDDEVVDDSELNLLDDDFDFDTMFSDDLDDSVIQDEVDFDSVLGDLTKREVLTKPSTGTWNFSLLMLNDISLIDKVKTDIENWALNNDIPLEVKTWEDSAGDTGKSIQTLRLIFLVLTIIIAVVTVIIIMNTLVVSIIERTSEIGTMRAIGGNKSFIRILFVIETLTVSLVFGTVGIFLALILISIFNKVGITFSGNEFLEIAFGSEKLYPITNLMTLLQGFIISVIIGLLSSIYPVSVALKIDPIKAIQS